jgi:hypothetical protein
MHVAQDFHELPQTGYKRFFVDRIRWTVPRFQMTVQRRLQVITGEVPTSWRKQNNVGFLTTNDVAGCSELFTTYPRLEAKTSKTLRFLSKNTGTQERSVSRRLLGIVHELPQTAHERLLLLLPFGTDSLYVSKSSDGSVKKGSKPPRIEVGTIVQGRVTSVKALQLNVELDRGLMGRVHVTEVRLCTPQRAGGLSSVMLIVELRAE